MLPRINRLNKEGCEETISKGKSAYSPFFSLRILSIDPQKRPEMAFFVRFTVVVSKKVAPHAVDRNYLKRITRECLRSVVSKTAGKSLFIVVFPSKEAVKLKNLDFNRELISILEKTGIISK